jgi:hypothetical protein
MHYNTNIDKHKYERHKKAPGEGGSLQLRRRNFKGIC